MKKRDIVTEYVPEYAKELVWDENYEALTNQEAIFEEQAHRINRLIGKVDVIVPILLYCSAKYTVKKIIVISSKSVSGTSITVTIILTFLSIAARNLKKKAEYIIWTKV